MIHQEHCNNCIRILKCVQPSYGGIRCSIVKCELGCGAQFHECKLVEHQLLCPKEKVPCINKANGCPALISRCLLAKHLKTCPANVIVCGMGWNRWPLLNTAHIVPTDGDISYAEGSPRCQPDLGLAVKDQFTFQHWLENLKKSSPEYESVDPVKFIIDGEVSDIFSGKFSSDTVYTEYASSASSLSKFKNGQAPYGAVNKVMHHFACSQVFRRDDYVWHSKNVHNDIHGSVNGWIEHRCPLAYRGCKYSLRRLYPNCKTSYIVQDACGNFGLRSDSESKTQAVNLLSHEGKSSIDVTHSLEEKASFESMRFLTARANTLSTLSLSIESTYSLERKPSTESTYSLEGKPSTESTYSVASKPSTESTLSLERKPSMESIYSSEGNPSTESTYSSEGNLSTESTYPLEGKPSTESTYPLEGKPSTESTYPLEGKPSTESTYPLEGKPSTESKYPLEGKPSTESTYPLEGKPSTESTYPLEGKPSTESTYPLEGKPSTESTYSLEGKPSTESKYFLEGKPSTESIDSLEVQPLEVQPSTRPACSVELLDLPCEVLRQLVSYLEPFSFRNVAATCKGLRSVCYSIIREKGIVIKDWKKCQSGNKVHWEMQPKRWLIPPAFPPIYRWGLEETNGAMSEHLKHCPYNERKELSSERVEVIWLH